MQIATDLQQTAPHAEGVVTEMQRSVAGNQVTRATRSNGFALSAVEFAFLPLCVASPRQGPRAKNPIEITLAVANRDVVPSPARAAPGAGMIEQHPAQTCARSVSDV